jgi:hypothetical protein
MTCRESVSTPHTIWLHRFALAAWLSRGQSVFQREASQAQQTTWAPTLIVDRISIAMEKPTEAYPLAWPVGWKREANRTPARFGKGVPQYGSDGQTSWTRKVELSIADGTQRVLHVLDQMGFNSSVVISSNLELRNDGLPRSNQRAPTDPGVAVYWGRGKTARCIAVDRYDRVADNLAAIAATLEAMRAIERHGGASILERAFTSFVALAAPEQPWQILGVGANATSTEIEDAYSRLAMKHHPDRGGDTHQMARINAARDELLRSR